MFYQGRQRADYQPAIWDVLFLAVPKRNWWDRLCDDEMGHVVAMGYIVTTDAYVLVDPAHVASSVLSAPLNEVEQLIQCLPGRLSAGVRVPAGPLGNARPRLTTTCVSVVSHVVGYPSRAFLPRAFYRQLLAVPEAEQINVV